MKVLYNRGALADIDEILNYLQQRNPAAAVAQLARFEAGARLISRNPFIGKQTLRPHLRRIVIGNYLMVYEVGADAITIHYVRHGKRQRPWEGE